MDLVGKGVNDLAESIKGLLVRFADDKGVSVQFHKKEPRMRFTWRTHDGLGCEIDYDINQTSRQYIDEMIQGLVQRIEGKRKERHESPIILSSNVGGIH